MLLNRKLNKLNCNPLLLEVNSSPGLEGIEGATNKDITGEMIKAIEKNFRVK
jgi:ribosomal protein S6--L-glutamate ligase